MCVPLVNYFPITVHLAPLNCTHSLLDSLFALVSSTGPHQLGSFSPTDEEDNQFPQSPNFQQIFRGNHHQDNPTGLYKPSSRRQPPSKANRRDHKYPPMPKLGRDYDSSLPTFDPDHDMPPCLLLIPVQVQGPPGPRPPKATKMTQEMLAKATKLLIRFHARTIPSALLDHHPFQHVKLLLQVDLFRSETQREKTARNCRRTFWK